MFKNLAFMQLKQLIEKGKNVNECKEEWKRRSGLDYPFYKSASGVKAYE